MTSDRPHPSVLLLFAFLLGMGSLIVWAGARAIRTRHYESRWEQDGGVTIGPFGARTSETHGIDIYDGTAAERMGAGLAAFGAMFVLWGLCGTWAVVRPASAEIGPAIGMALCAVSFLLQTTALVCVLPPWRIGSGIGPVFWATMVAAAVAGFVVPKMRSILRRRPKFWKRILKTGAVVVACAAIFSRGRAWAGLILGIFALLSYAVHVGAVYTWLEKRSSASRSTPRASSA